MVAAGISYTRQPAPGWTDAKILPLVLSVRIAAISGSVGPDAPKIDAAYDHPATGCLAPLACNHPWLFHEV
ncbi:MAG TPA: hypothetical protein DHV36_00715 [Desulfobacteraceae bacterium]|nr:hypothetical protein [Desulfobacteraceae bacterium]|tara:strand:+ start:1759 stop:1971 length:213 start_codon:yes stop_codon:yes gene_type:complete